MGWEDLGNVLAGGIDREGQYQAGRFRSAQTEEALASARVNQANAVKAEQINNQRAALEVARANGQLDFANPSNDMLAQFALGDMAANLAQVGDFNLDAQQLRHRNIMADPNQSALRRTRAAQAVEGKPSSDLVAVGSRGYTNLTDDTPELSVIAGLDDGESDWLSGPGKMARDRDRILQKFGPNSRQLADFDAAAAKMANNGGVTYVVPTFGTPNPTTPGAQPAPSPSRPTVAPVEAAHNKALLAQGTAEGTAAGQAAAAAPNAQSSVQNMLTDVQELLNDAGFDMAYGKDRAVLDLSPLNMTPKEFRSAKGKLDQLTGEAFSVAIKELKGTGPVSNAEGQKVQQAYALALNPSLDEVDARAAWDRFAKRLAKFNQALEQERNTALVPRTSPVDFNQPAAPSIPPLLARPQNTTKVVNGKTYVQVNGEWYEDDGT